MSADGTLDGASRGVGPRLDGRWQVLAGAVGVAGVFGVLVAYVPTVSLLLLLAAAWGALFVRNQGRAALVLAAAGLLMLRPAVGGEDFTPVGVAGLALAAALILLGSRAVDRDNKAPLVAFMVAGFWGFLLLHASLVGSGNMGIVVRAAASNAIVVVAGAVVLSDRDRNRWLFRALVVTLAGCAASWVVTVLVAVVVSYDQLLLFQLPVGGYTTAGNVYFPFSVIANFQYSGLGRIPRLMGVFREPGIYQAFCIWGLFTLRDLELDHWAWRVLLVIGVVGSLSTAGLVLLPATFGVAYLLRRTTTAGVAGRAVGLPALVGLSIWLLWSAPVVGLDEKVAVHASSLDQRLGAAVSAVEQLEVTPLGTGLYDSFEDENAGIHLVGQASEIGVIGVAGYLLVIGGSLAVGRRRRNGVVAYFPVFMTAALAQPLLTAPLAYLLLMVDRRPSDSEAGGLE